jgi:hypothetical protein
MAHALQGRFSQGEKQPFSVENEVRQWRYGKGYKALLPFIVGTRHALILNMASPLCALKAHSL